MALPRYILVKVYGRGAGRAPYHELAADGTNPLCGVQIHGENWELVRITPYLARRKVACVLCRQQWLQEQQQQKGTQRDNQTHDHAHPG